ncbi:MAG: hypothetical protein WC980_08260 [Candidatus Brocadiia bacterium]
MQIGYPAGGEVFTVNNNPTITGTKSTTVTKIKIEYYNDGTSPGWETLAASYDVGSGNTWSYGGWTVTDKISSEPLTPTAKIRVTDVTDINITDIVATSNNFKVKGALSVSSPAGFEEWLVGSSKVITWTGTGSVSPVNIYYSTDNFATVTKTIDTNVLAGSGLRSYTWSAVGDDITSGYTVKIKVCASNDQSNVIGLSSGFKIKGALQVMYPTNSGLEFEVGTPITITWRTTGQPKNVRIVYYTDLIPETEITASTAATYSLVSGVTYDGRYPNWTIPNAVSKKMRIKIYDKDDSGVNDISDNDFRVKAKITVTSPNNGSEVGIVGANPGLLISWVITGTASNVKLEYTVNNGITWTNITTVAGNSSPYSWVIPDVSNIISQNCRIRVTDDDVGETDISDASDSLFRIRGKLNLDTPNVAADYEVGDTVAFQWTATGPIANVNILYSTDDFVNVTNTLYTNLATGSGTKTQNWTIPNDFADLVSSRVIKFRVVDSADGVVYDNSDAAFKIKGKFQITDPNTAGTTWLVGETRTITWTTTGKIGSVNIQYTKGDGSWTTFSNGSGVVNNENGTTALTISVPDAVTTTFRVRVVNQVDSLVNDPCDYDIRVRGQLQVTDPTASTKWQVGNQQNIQWTVFGSIRNVNIDYWNQPLGLWVSITTSAPATNTPGAGVYLWTIPNLIRDDVKVRIIQSDDSGVSSESLAFKIRGKIQVNNPNGTETYYPYDASNQPTKYPITYTVTGSIAQVRVEYSVDGASGPWSVITTTNIGTTGVYNYMWEVPGTLADIKKTVRVRVIDNADSDINDFSDADFEVRGIMRVTQPSSSDVWEVGQSGTIMWNVTGAVGDVTLQYIQPADGLWYNIATVSTTWGANSYVWSSVADAITSTAKVRVKPLIDRADTAVSDSFKLKGRVLVNAPVFAYVAEVGEQAPISWAISGTISTVAIQYKVGIGGWEDIITMPAGLTGGTYYWTTPDRISSNVRVRVFDTSVPEATDDSEQFEIRGKLTLDYPSASGVEDWVIFGTYPITWTAQGSISQVEINYSLDNGLTYPGVITTTASGAGTHVYYWTVPDIASAAAKIRVRDTSNPDNVKDPSDYSFRIRGTINVNYPGVGNVFTVGDPITITGTKSSGVTKADILYWNGNLGQYVTVITSTAVGSGMTWSYNWYAPDCVRGDLNIKVIFSDDTSISDIGESFRVKGNLTLYRPNGGESFTVYTTEPITWTKFGSISNVNLYYSIDNFTATSKQIASNIGASLGYFDWSIPDDIDGSIWVRITDAGYEAGTYDDSNNPFKIHGKVEVVSPNGGQEFICNSVQPVTWTVTGSITKVRLAYTYGDPDGRTTEVVIQSDVAGTTTGTTGVYMWNVPNNLIASKVRIKVYDNNDPTVWDDSDNTFKIRGEITAKSPNGNEIWLVGNEYPISWTSTGPIANVGIQLSIDATHSTWETLVTSTPNSGLFNWTVLDRVSATSKIRIFDASDPTVRDDSDINFRIRGRFNVIYPNGGQVFTVGQNNVPITWTSAGTMDTVKIEYSKDDFNSDINTIVASTENDGSYSWPVIPDAIVATMAIKIRVSSTTDSGAKDESDSGFKIKGDLTINAPNNAGIVWTVGEQRPIQWGKTGDISQIELKYSNDGGLTYPNSITITNASALSYTWTVPNDICVTPKIKIKITDVADPTTVNDDSDNAFKIKGNIIIGAPVLNDIFTVYNASYYPATHPITWTLVGTINNVKIDYSSDNFTSNIWPVVASTSGPAGIYNWQVEDRISAVKIRISDAADSSVYVDSDQFYIKGKLFITAPLSGEAWKVGASRNIQWNTTGTIATVKLDYFSPALNDWTTITPSTNNSGIFGWTIPDDITYSNNVKVRVISTVDPTIYTDSNGFKIRGDFVVDQPNTGTETWEVATNKVISWTTTGTINNIDLLYSIDNFASTTWTIITNTVNSGTYNWTIPDNVSDSVRIRVRDTNDPTLVYDNSNNNFKIVARMQVTKPVVTDKWQVGEKYTVKWKCWGTVPDVRLDYSTVSPFTAWKPITSTYTNNASSDGVTEGTYEWTIPNDISETVLIRVADTRYPALVYDDSEQFKIKGAIRITSPVFNDTFFVYKVGANPNPHNIVFTITGTGISTVKILRSNDNFASSSEITASLAVGQGENIYPWQVNDPILPNVKIRVEKTDDPETKSDSEFFYVKGKFTVTAPGAGAYIVGSTIPVQWMNSGTIANVKLEYWSQLDGNWKVISGAGNAPNTGSYSWDIPNDITPLYNIKVKVTHAADPTSYDESDVSQLFKIRGAFNVIFPNASSDTLRVGESTAVSWGTIGTMEYVKLEYSTDEGSNWINPAIESSLLNENTYSWTIPNAITTTARFRVSYVSDPTVYDISDNNFRIMGKIKVNQPNTDGLVLYAGDNYPISWTNTGTIPTVRLEYSEDEFSTPISITDVSCPTPGEWNYSWPIPANAIRSHSNWKVRVYDIRYSTTTTNKSDNGFKIRGNFNIAEPIGGRADGVWVVNDPMVITWTTTGSIPNIKVFYSKNEFVTSYPLPAGYSDSNNGLFNWTVQDFITTDKSVQIRIVDASDPTVYRDSVKFKIRGNLAITQPAGLEVWTVNTVKNIFWTSTGSIPNVRLEYSRDNFTSEIVEIAVRANTAGANSYDWTIPNAITPITDGVKVRVVDILDSSVLGISSGFKIRGNLSVAEPIGGRANGMWTVGETMPITWTTTGTIANVKLEYSTNGGSTWIMPPIESSLLNANSYTWVVPDAITTAAQFRISDIGDSTVYDTSNNNFIILGKIKITQPDISGLVWYAENTYAISWTTYSSTLPTVRLEYSEDDFSTPIFMADVNCPTPGDWGYNWTIPANRIKPHSNWKVRAYDIRYSADTTDKSDNGFKIRGNFNIAEPVGGRVSRIWEVGETMSITWTTTGAINNVRVLYSKNNFVNSYEAYNGANTGLLNWQVADLITLNQEVKIRIVDSADDTVYRDSVAFKIRGSLNVTQPVGLETWTVGEVKIIRWNSNGSIPSVNLEYSLDNFATPGQEITTVTNTVGANSYNWIIPPDAITTQADGVKIRVADPNDAAVYSTSNGFKIRGDFQINTPAGGEAWIVSNIYSITWTTKGSISAVNIYYSTDNFGPNTWAVVTNTSNTGFYSWQVPDRISAAVKIRIYDSNDSLVWNRTPCNDFKIRGNFVMNSPKASDAWAVYHPVNNPVTYPITWTTIGTIARVKIEYWSPGVGDWTLIDNFYDNSTGIYNWQVPDLITFGADSFATKIKITDANDPAVYKESGGFKVRPKFIVTAPIANSSLVVSRKYWINWTTVGTVPAVRLEYLRGGTVWTAISGAENMGNTNSYEWTVPDDITQNFSTKVRILDTRDVTVTDGESAGFKVCGEFTIGSPNGSEQWDVGETKTITWTNLGTIPNLRLEYSLKGDWTDTVQIINSVTNTGSYNWLITSIPDKITQSPTVKIRATDIRDALIYDDSNNGFKIRPKFTVTYPNAAGIQLDVDQNVNITWTTDGNAPNVKIEYSKDDFGMDINTIIASTANTGLFSWTVPNDITSPDFKVKIRVSDVRDYDAKDDSNNHFKIRAKFTVDSPNTAGIVWVRGETRTISWTNTGSVNSVKLEYSKDNFVSDIHTVIANVLNNTSLKSGSYDWTVPDDITSPDFKVNIRVSDSRDDDARDDSDNPLKIRGNLVVGYPNGSEILKVGDNCLILWTTTGTIPTVKIEYFNNTDWVTIITSTANANSYSWTVPDRITIDYPILVRVSDTRDPAVTTDSSTSGFKIRANIQVGSPNGGENLFVDTNTTLSWTVTGTVPTVRLEYSIDDFTTVKVITNSLVNNIGLNTYVWPVPDDISLGPITKLRVVDTRDPADAYDISDAGFRIKGWFNITGPAIDYKEYRVGRTQPITWTTFGTMAIVKLQYSKDNFVFDINDIDTSVSNVSNGVRVYNWTVPNDITPDERVKIRVSLPGDPEIYADSMGFKILSDITVTAPVGGERWITNEEHNINWQWTGTVPQVTLQYSKDNFVSDIQTIYVEIAPNITSSAMANFGTFIWTIPDDKNENVKVRVCDSRDLAAFGQSPNKFKIDYYYITFIILDDVTRLHLSALTIKDMATGTTEFPVSSPKTKGYPYGVYQTLIWKTGYLDVALDYWIADSDKTFTLKMEGSVVHGWDIMADFKYDPSSDDMHVTSWFMRDGLLMPEPDKVEIELYDETGTFVKKLESSTPREDGVFSIDWMDTGLESNTTYWAKVGLTYAGKTFTSALTYNINIPVKLQSLANAAANIQNTANTIQTNVEAISATAVSTKETAEDIQRKVRTLVILPETVDRLEEVSNTMREQLTDVRTTIRDEVKGVLKKGVLAEIVTRETVVKTGDTLSIKYRLSMKGLTPLITVYDPRLEIKISQAIMTEISTPQEESGLYEYPVKFDNAWGLGEFTIICEDLNTKATDSIVITVVQSNLDDVNRQATIIVGQTGQTKELSAKLDMINGDVQSVISTVSNIRSSTAEGKLDSAVIGQINTEVRGVADKLKVLAGDRGFNLDTLYRDIVNAKTDDMKDINNQLSTLKALEDLTRKIFERTNEKYIVTTQYIWGSVKMIVRAYNKSNEEIQVEVKAFLPQEIKEADVLERGDFVTGYDSVRRTFFVELPADKRPTLRPNEIKEYEITLQNVWLISEQEITDRRDQSLSFVKQLEKNPYYEKALFLRNTIETELQKIENLQTKAKNAVSPEELISTYRDNRERLIGVDRLLDILRKLAFPELAEGENMMTITGLEGLVGKGAAGTTAAGEGGGFGIDASSSWKLILVVLSFLGLISVAFFFIWQQQLKKSRVSPELNINAEDLKMPEVGKSGEER